MSSRTYTGQSVGRSVGATNRFSLCRRLWAVSFRLMQNISSAQTLRDLTTFDIYVHPTGSGPLLIYFWKGLNVIFFNRIAMQDWISKCNIGTKWWLLLSANLLRHASSASRDWKYQEYCQWHYTKVNIQVGLGTFKIMSSVSTQISSFSNRLIPCWHYENPKIRTLTVVVCSAPPAAWIIVVNFSKQRERGGCH